MKKLIKIQEKYKISLREISKVIDDTWETSTPIANLHRIITGKTGLEVYTLLKIVSAINIILKQRESKARITPNDLVDYEEFLYLDD